MKGKTEDQVRCVTGPMSSRFRKMGLLAGTGLALALLQCPAAAALDDHPIKFNIPPQNLASALAAYASQAQMQMIAPSNLVEGIKTAGLSGEYSSGSALSALLAPAGLGYSMADPHTVAVVKLAQAQPMPARPQSESGAATGGAPEEIVVVARRKEERLQDVPVSISVLTQSAFRDNNIQSIRDLATLVPSLFVGYGLPDFFPITIRGQGAYQAGGTPSTVSYLNEVPVPAFPNGGDAMGERYYDLENLQVLEGPQGTLFGRNTIGGALLYQSKRPTNNFEGYFEATIGNYNQHDFDFAVNLPIVDDKVLLRVAGQRLARDGYVNRLGDPGNVGLDVLNRDVWAGRATLTLRPSDNLQNDTIFEVLSQHNNGQAYVLAAVNPTGLAQRFFPTLPSMLAKQQALGEFTLLPSDVVSLMSVHTWSVTDILRYDITDDITLRNIVGYFVSSYANQEDFDDTVFPILDSYATYPGATKNHQISEEFQLQGKSFDQKLSWVAGIFASDLEQPDFDNYVNLIFGAKRALSSESPANTVAVYAQGTYDLSALLDGLKFTAGVRYTWDERSTNTSSIQATATQSQQLSTSFHEPTWTVGLDYHLLPTTMVYVTGSRGFRDGGFNTGTVTFPVGLDVYGPEYVTNLEAGVKSDWEIFGMKGRTNLAAYYEWYDSIQITQNVPYMVGGSTLLASVIQNAGSAELDGGEFTGQIYPTHDLQLSATASYVHKSFTELAAGVNPAVAIFNPQTTPQWQITAGAQYHLPIDSAFGDISFGSTWTWVSTAVNAIDFRPEPFDKFKAHGLLNFNADWKGVMGSSFDLAFYMTNALDKNYYYSIQPFYYSLGFSEVSPGAPRMYGFRVRYNFGP